MPTVTITIDRVERINPSRPKIVELEASFNNRRIIRLIDLTQFSTVENFATWLINQSHDKETDTDWGGKQLVITFHNDAEQGRVVDDVQVVSAS
jgi:hypothetical protein